MCREQKRASYFGFGNWHCKKNKRYEKESGFNVDTSKYAKIWIQQMHALMHI